MRWRRMNKSICPAESIGYAVLKARQEARARHKVVYVYKTEGYLYMTTIRPSRKKVVYLARPAGYYLEGGQL